MNISKLKHIVVVSAIGTNFALPLLAADDTAPVANSNAAATSPAPSAEAATQAEEIKLLKQQLELLTRKVNELEKQSDSAGQTATIESLDQKVRILERQRENDQEAALAAAKNAPKINVGPNGLSISSADTNFVTQIHGLFQEDYRSFFDNGDVKGTDGFLLRRARPILSGTLFRDFDYNFTPEFGGSSVQIQDAYAIYRNRPELQLQVGKFKSPVGLEALQSDAVGAFNERSLATDLVPNRDIGIALKGDFNGSVAAYAVGVFNGAADFSTTANTPSQDNKAFVGRVFFQPWKKTEVAALRGFGFGVGGSYELDNPNTNSSTGLTSGYTTDGQQKFFSYNKNVYADGKHWRVSPQAYYYYGPFGFLAEYVISDQKVSSGAVGGPQEVGVHNTAWEVTGSWILTGEDAAYAGLTPRKPFDPRKNQWGAWQLVARYAELDVDNDVFKGTTTTRLAGENTASGAKAWAFGLNWYLNKNLRANLSFSHTRFNGYTHDNSKASAAAQDENCLFSRFQLAF